MNDDAPASLAGPGGEPGFDQYYFQHCCGRPYQRDDHWLGFFSRIADQIVADFQPRRVLDAGCAFGMLVETLRARGIEAEGIDISSYAVGQAEPSVRPFCRVGSIAQEFPDGYDLIVSIEVLEHMPAAEGDAAIANFCRHTDDVLFSSSASDFREPTHVNVQPAEYWAERFARHGFYRDVDFDASAVTPWAVRFRRRPEPVARIVRDYERWHAPLVLERNERRQYVREVQHQVEAGLERIAALERERTHIIDSFNRDRDLLHGELASARASIEELHDQVNRKVLEADQAAAREFQLRRDLEHAHAVIRMMETSIFWRVRKWLRRP